MDPASIPQQGRLAENHTAAHSPETNTVAIALDLNHRNTHRNRGCPEPAIAQHSFDSIFAKTGDKHLLPNRYSPNHPPQYSGRPDFRELAL